MWIKLADLATLKLHFFLQFDRIEYANENFE